MAGHPGKCPIRASHTTFGLMSIAAPFEHKHDWLAQSASSGITCKDMAACRIERNDLVPIGSTFAMTKIELTKGHT